MIPRAAVYGGYDCLSVTFASVGGPWDTVPGTYFPNANPCGGVAIYLAGQTRTECQTCGTGFYSSSENVCHTLGSNLRSADPRPICYSHV